MKTVLFNEDGKQIKFGSPIEAAIYAEENDLDFEVATRQPIHRKGKSGGKNRKFDERKAGRKQKELERKFYAEMEN